MELGMIGLGRMGGNMLKKLVESGHTVIGYDLNPKNIKDVVSIGGKGADSIEDLLQKLKQPRNIWVMLPHGTPTAETIENIIELAAKDDLIIDGGNSHYLDSMKIAEKCISNGVRFTDCGVSGGSLLCRLRDEVFVQFLYWRHQSKSIESLAFHVLSGESIVIEL
jgi:6-phosphogluconate dehydrogenase